MSMLRNVLTYMGLGPDEDYDDGYLYDAPEERSSARRTGARRAANDRIEVEPDPDPSIDDDDGFEAGSGFDRDRAEDRAGAGDRSDWFDDPGATEDEEEPPWSVAPAEPDPAPAAGPDEATVARPGSGLRAELRSRVAASRPLRAVPPAVLAAPIGARDEQVEAPEREIPTDLVQPENGITVRAVTAEADMAYETSVVGTPVPPRQVAPRSLSPRSFGDAKILADAFKDDVPVVMNLLGIERDLARRLIDFASGICYALDGSMEKLASQVFLLTPPSVEVSDADRRRLEERGYGH